MKKKILKQVVVPIASLRREPSNASELETQCLFGEKVSINLYKKNWSLCETVNDFYTGWIETKFLSNTQNSSHKIINSMSHIYRKPNIKSGVVTKLFFESRLLTSEYNSIWSEINLNNKNYYIYKKHIAPINKYCKDWLEVSSRFLGSPYLWGGKTFNGIDCSGLVQLSLSSCGISFPRNTKEQFDFLHPKIKNVTEIDCNCLIFWEGHVAIALKKK